MLLHLICLLPLAMPSSLGVRGDIAPEAVARCKHATALVLAGDNAMASAFHVGQGLFVTNAHVVRDAEGGKIRLVLDPGETTQRIVAASALRADANLDLALLRIEEPKLPAALDLGDDSTLIETTTLTAFGYPFGKDLAVGKNDYPGVTVSVGRITALRRAEGKVQRIQLDASLNPGNSGGPVVNSSGQVVGIVESGIVGAGINFAIPVEHLRRFLYGPAIGLHAPSLQKSTQSNPSTFTIDVISLAPGSGDVSVSLRLSSHSQDRRDYKATAAGGGHFTVTAPLVPTADEGMLEATVEEQDSTWIVWIKDQLVRIGQRSIRLSTIREITQGVAPQVLFSSGQTMAASVSGLNALGTVKNGAPATINLSQAHHISLAPVDSAIQSVRYEIAVRRNGEIAAQQTGTIAADGVHPDIILTAQAAEKADADAATQQSRGYFQAVLADHPIAYYRLNERRGSIAHNSAGNGIDGTLIGDLTSIQPGAIVNDPDGAISFDGTGYVHVDAASCKRLSMTGSFSIEAWIRQKDFSESQCVLSKGHDQTPGYYRILFNKDKHVFQFNVKFDQSGQFGEDVLVDASAVPVLEWHHLVGVYDAADGELRFYVDGELASKVNVAGKTLTGNDQDFEIAAMPDPGNLGYRYYFGGAIDEVAIYRSALSSSRIALHYRLGTGDH